MAKKVSTDLGMEQALHNIGVVAGIDLFAPPLLGVLRFTKFVTDVEEGISASEVVFPEEGSGSLVTLLEESFHVVERYVEKLLVHGWDSLPKKEKDGIVSILELTAQAAEKMDGYLSFRFGKGEISLREGPSFLSLQRIYQENVAKDPGEGDLWDRERLREDLEYEMFFLKDPEGFPYFSSEMVREMRIRAEFSATGASFEEDPFLQVQAMWDREAQGSAAYMLQMEKKSILLFYQRKKEWFSLEWGEEIHKAILALFLAANPHNLVSEAKGKHCLQYFADFLTFLRSALRSREYLEDPHAFSWLREVTLGLSRAFFTHPSTIRQEMIGLLHRSMRKGEELAPTVRRGSSPLEEVAYQDEKLRFLFARFPSGPLLRLLDLLQQGETGEEEGFDPVLQGNYPHLLWEKKIGKNVVQFLKIPSPTYQLHIQKADVVPEFRAFLSSLDSSSSHLLVQLQDKTSAQEFARVKALDLLQKNVEFRAKLQILTLPKSTSFYHQKEEYLHCPSSEVFFRQIEEQIEGEDSTGFGFPSRFGKEALLRFVKKEIPRLHRELFSSKKGLSREERQAFLERLYHAIICEAIEVVGATSISFTCKDSVDTGAAAMALFYALEEGLEEKGKRDFFFYLLYAPAILVRERAIQGERLGRVLGCLGL